MKKQHVSDPAIIEIFRVRNDQDMIDTEKSSWNRASLLQGAMESYEPDKYQAEVLIKLTQESPVIRTKIEELDIEERQGTTALFAELLRLNQPTITLLHNTEALNKVLWIDSNSGKLVGVVISGKEVPESIVESLLTKVFRGKLYPELIVVHQTPVSFIKIDDAPQQNDKSAEDLMNAIKNYLNHSVASKNRDFEVEPFKLLHLLNKLKPEADSQPEKTEEEQEVQLGESDQEFQQLTLKQATRTDILQSRFKNKRQRPLVQKSLKINEMQSETENLEAEWLKSSNRMNWKQRKNHDRTIVDLSEKIFGLLKSKSAPTQEMMISFLASLSAMQLEFFENLVNSFVTAKMAEVEMSSSDSISKESKVQDSLPLEQISNLNMSLVENQGDAIKHSFTQGNPGSQQQVMKEDMLTQDLHHERIQSVNNVNPSNKGMEEFGEISQEEKELHLKILEYQKTHNVSYDHAASMVLK